MTVNENITLILLGPPPIKNSHNYIDYRYNSC